MTQYDFDKLLEKYLQGACSPEEELLLDEWTNRQMTTETVVLSEQETKTVKKQLWKRIKRSAFPSLYPLDAFSFITMSAARTITLCVTGRDSIKWLSWTKLGIAASLVFIFSVSAWYSGVFQAHKIGSRIEKQTGVEMTNTTGKAQIITLNDGSTVNLQPNSTLTFPEKFGDHNRIVYLKGEGFFKVKRDTTKPFYVYAGSLVTEVLGTSFTVKSFDNDKVAEVIVVSGKVMVYNSKNREVGKKEVLPTVLTPNQKVVFEKTTQQIKPEVVEKPLVLNPPKSIESFLFQEVPLFEVLHKIQEVYGLKIIPSANLKDCVFTGDLNGLELYDQLDFICKSINAQIEKQETNILIKGEGC